ncbi:MULTISPECIES: hypothetical protein [unclassified Fusibacter]|uniref:hypothetical protein n=1 Tax=unclassified Fusibacter TaxID=2624464 RepID=UPI001012A9BD|nr:MULTISPECIES: hypothetical protein [unclassified Fusibacter]MCK8060830.1 hypothetical protein [Fusibacter sp. A2]NPE23126.1 hypothetical protein [Fusibacter sp. A1]RXV59798.1 hypothetical protein DWB64_14940 [Fusibacter sp. A1]
MRKITIISHPSIDSIVLTLELAHTLSFHARTACDLKSDHPLGLFGGKQKSLLQLNDIILDLESEVSDEMEYCICNEIEGESDYYLAIIEPNLVSIESVKSKLKAINPVNVSLVYLNALDGKLDMDYLQKYHLNTVYEGDVASVYEIPYDEKNKEQQLCSQLDGVIQLGKQSKEKRQMLASMARDIMKLDKKAYKQLQKRMMRRN